MAANPVTMPLAPPEIPAAAMPFSQTRKSMGMIRSSEVAQVSLSAEHQLFS